MDQLIRCGSTPQKSVMRMRVVLGASKGISNSQIASDLGITRSTVIKWRERYREQGLEGILEDAPRSGRRKTITPEKHAEIVQATLMTKPVDATQWSTRTMAAAQCVSDTTMYRIWNAHRLQPHRVETFKFSRDPRFAEKVRDIVGLYMNPPQKALVLCVDEKSQIQALDRTQPMLPLRPNLPERQTHDYKRHGTTTLFAALNALDGTVLSQCEARHRNQEFVRFLDKINRTVPDDLDVHVVLDNYGTHTHANVQQWLEQHQRYHLHFTPTGASWVNLVERFFSEITERRLRRGTFRSVPELVRAISTYIKNRNRSPKPFLWTATASSIIRKVRRCAAISEAGH
ncbi:MAG TPA: IS630 family transposase [Bryobacteraceae bacterium]|nr:IS630 family transposase [Bryobacteraceae bacterium]